jgi:hypothetical protein
MDSLAGDALAVVRAGNRRHKSEPEQSAKNVHGKIGPAKSLRAPTP